MQLYTMHINYIDHNIICFYIISILSCIFRYLQDLLILIVAHCEIPSFYYLIEYLHKYRMLSMLYKNILRINCCKIKPFYFNHFLTFLYINFSHPKFNYFLKNIL